MPSRYGMVRQQKTTKKNYFSFQRGDLHQVMMKSITGLVRKMSHNGLQIFICAPPIITPSVFWYVAISSASPNWWALNLQWSAAQYANQQAWIKATYRRKLLWLIFWDLRSHRLAIWANWCDSQLPVVTEFLLVKSLSVGKAKAL